MEQRTFFIPSPQDASLRISYTKGQGRILRFVVQLEAYLEEAWTPITRYDTAHQFVHRDDLKPDGSQIKTPPMAFANYEDAFNFAIRDLRLNYSFYINRYLQWKNI